MTISQTEYRSVLQYSEFGFGVAASGPYVVVTTQTNHYLWVFRRESGVLVEVVTAWRPVPNATCEGLRAPACWWDSETDRLHIVVGAPYSDTLGFAQNGRVFCCTYDYPDSTPVVVATFDGSASQNNCYFGWTVTLERTGRFAAASEVGGPKQGLQILRRDNDHDWYLDGTIYKTDLTPNITTVNGQHALWVDDYSNVWLAISDNLYNSVAYTGIGKQSCNSFYMVSDEDMGGAPPVDPRPGSCYVVNNWGGGYTDGDMYEYRGVEGWHLIEAGVGGYPRDTRACVVSDLVDPGGSFAGKQTYHCIYSTATHSWTCSAPVDTWVATGVYQHLFYGVRFAYFADSGRWEPVTTTGSQSGAYQIFKRPDATGTWGFVQRIDGIMASSDFAFDADINKIIPTKTILAGKAKGQGYTMVTTWRLTEDETRPWQYDGSVRLPSLSGVNMTGLTVQAIGYRVMVGGYFKAYGATYGEGWIGGVAAYADGTFPMVPEAGGEFLLKRTTPVGSDYLTQFAAMQLVYQEGGYIRLVAGCWGADGSPSGCVIEFDCDVDFPELPSGGTWPPAPPSLDYVDPDIIPDNGGVILTITGDLPTHTDLEVHLGPLGTKEDPICYGGEGYGYLPWSQDGVTLIVASPPVSIGVRKLSVWEGDTFLGSLDVTVVEHFWPSRTPPVRRDFPPWSDVGARQLSEEN